MRRINELIDEWIQESSDVCALYLRQLLEPVECDPNYRIVYPPTYADIGYCIDTLSDGKKVALIDSVGSQANRMEPLFKCQSDNPDDWLVPQIRIVLRREKTKHGEEEKARTVTVSLLDIAHRAADAVVRSTEGLGEILENAFQKLANEGDAWDLAAIAPTSLVFGVWDSRGSTSEKRPRLVRAIVRAWDVEVLHAAAQFNSVWKLLSDEQKERLKEIAKKTKTKTDLAELGFKDAPAVFRKVQTKQTADVDARVLGGVLVKGEIVREVTVNLSALRGLRSSTDERTRQLRRYLLGLALKAATAELDPYYREGCHLRIAQEEPWKIVPRRGDPEVLELDWNTARAELDQALEDYVRPFREEWRKRLKNPPEYEFSIDKVRELLAKAATTSESEEG